VRPRPLKPRLPNNSRWRHFELPVRVTELRHIALAERSGTLKIVMPVYRVNAMGVMVFRSEEDIAKLKQMAR
jgi:hypothetical protein